ncbi:tRNA uridine-5-carboxymethylaminomethyl(34) synthesis GTPase MnmE [Candidatus Latescibacterota bacterium]
MPFPYHISDTIAAISTAPGRSGISIVKISGPDAVKFVKSIFSNTKHPDFLKRAMIYGHIVDKTDHIDDVLVCVMKAPSSYTGEDVVEIQSHGGYAAAETILGILLKSGVRVAGPGEFTKRAFLNGRLDLAQAEGVMEIVSADTREHLKNAEHLLEGAFSKQIDALISSLTKTVSLLEYNIDFQDGNTESVLKGDIKDALRETIKTLDTMITSYKTAKRIKYGLNVVIAGNVNSGKSSLFNKLLGKNRAIVNSTKGTTRDWIEEKIDLGGMSVNLIDTAGIRHTEDEIEREGVRKTEKLLKKADLILYLHNAKDAASLPGNPHKDSQKQITLLSRCDLAPDVNALDGAIPVSSKTGTGIDRLTVELTKRAESLIKSGTTDALVMVDRHRIEIERARKNLKTALLSADEWSEEIISFEMTEALSHLEAVVGRNISIDVLDEIFRNFCVGK